MAATTTLTIGIDASRANVLERTGTEWYLFNLLQELKTIIPSQYKVILYTKDKFVNDMQDWPQHWEHKILHWPPKLLWTQLRMSLTMLSKTSRPDVLFIPAHTIPIIHPKKTIYVAHDMGFERFPELYSKSYIGGRAMSMVVRMLTLGKYSTNELDYHRWSMEFAVQHAAHIVTISEFTKQEIQHFYNTSTTTVSVIYNGFTSKDYYSLPNIGPPKQPYILFVGRIEYKKNIPNLIKAFAKLKQQYKIPHQLWLVGQPGHGYEEVKSLISEYHLESDVMEKGYVPQEQMNTMMNQASLFVFPTNYEGFGIPILEALSAETIVACSDLPVLHEIGGEACMYFNHHDPDNMAVVVHEALQLESSEKEYRQHLGKSQVKKFSWESCALNTWQTIQKVLENSK